YIIVTENPKKIHNAHNSFAISSGSSKNLHIFLLINRCGPRKETLAIDVSDSLCKNSFKKRNSSTSEIIDKLLIHVDIKSTHIEICRRFGDPFSATLDIECSLFDERNTDCHILDLKCRSYKKSMTCKLLKINEKLSGQLRVNKSCFLLQSGVNENLAIHLNYSLRSLEKDIIQKISDSYSKIDFDILEKVDNIACILQFRESNNDNAK
ncbi:MAG: hypothetical protein MHMPM18_001856, partial [Marteilia pararefringens]